MNIGTTEHGKAVNINLERLIESRLLVQANSGAGKSWALRRILEQSYSKVQQIVIDVEDEFYTLREKFDYVLAGRQGGDCPADVRSANLLARRLLELGTSAIIGIYELKSHDRIRFVRLFLESLVAAPRSLWHPVLVVIDECHLFAPEKGHGEAESSQAVIDLMTLGRKRGFCGIPATQRISKLHKDVCEVNNKLIGRSALDVDMKRAARELGFSSRDQELDLRSMKPGEFFAFGPAISDVVVKIKVGPVETTHPKSGQQIAPPPPPRATVRAVLSQLADLPKEAEQEALTIADLKKQVRELKASASQPAQSKEVPAERLQKEFERGVLTERKKLRSELQPVLLRVHHALHRIWTQFDENPLDDLEELLAQFRTNAPVPDSIPASTSSMRVAGTTSPRQTPLVLTSDSNGSGELKSGARRMLAVLTKWHPASITEGQLRAESGMRKGGTFSTYKSNLSTLGYIEKDYGKFRATEAGVAAIGDNALDVPQSTEDVLRIWAPKLKSGARRILDCLIAKGGMTKEALQQATELSEGGTFSTYISNLRTANLIVKEGSLICPNRETLLL